MKISVDKAIFADSKFDFLSDDSRDFAGDFGDSGRVESGVESSFESRAESKKNPPKSKKDPPKIAFVKTKLNERFAANLLATGLKNAPIIAPDELSNYLLQTPKIIGITGTNGKTTSAFCIYTLLHALGFSAAVLGTRGLFINGVQSKKKGLTTPSLLEIYADLHAASLAKCDYFVMEVSSHAIAQERIAGLRFALKILTNITRDHLDYHGTLAEYERVKNAFFADEGAKLINKDSPNARFNPVNAYTYGIEKAGNLALNAYAFKDCISGHFAWSEPRFAAKNAQDCAPKTAPKNAQNAPQSPQNGKKNGVQNAQSSPAPREDSLFSSPLIGRHNLYNILASVAAVKILEPHIALSDIAAALEGFGGVEGRLEIVHKNPLVVVDFAHTPDGMKNVLSSFLGRKIAVVFGAGGDRDRLKRPEMGRIAEQFASKIYLTSDNPRSEKPEAIIEEILGGIRDRGRVVVECDRKSAINLALRELERDWVLLILGKGDETSQIIGDLELPFDDRAVVREFYGG